MNFDNNALCDICGKPRITLGRAGRQEHPVCAKVRQKNNADKKRKPAAKTLNKYAGKYFSKFP